MRVFLTATTLPTLRVLHITDQNYSRLDSTNFRKETLKRRGYFKLYSQILCQRGLEISVKTYCWHVEPSPDEKNETGNDHNEGDFVVPDSPEDSPVAEEPEEESSIHNDLDQVDNNFDQEIGERIFADTRGTDGSPSVHEEVLHPKEYSSDHEDDVLDEVVGII